MEVVPRGCSRTIGDTAEILLVEVIGAGEVSVGIDDDIAMGVGLLLKLPGKNVVGVGGIEDATIASEAELHARAVGKCSHPGVTQLLIADEDAFVFAEEVTVGQRDQFL